MALQHPLALRPESHSPPSSPPSHFAAGAFDAPSTPPKPSPRRGLLDRSPGAGARLAAYESKLLKCSDAELAVLRRAQAASPVAAARGARPARRNPGDIAELMQQMNSKVADAVAVANTVTTQLRSPTNRRARKTADADEPAEPRTFFFSASRFSRNFRRDAETLVLAFAEDAPLPGR